MPSHPAAVLPGRRRALAAIMLLLLVLGIGLAFFATRPTLPPNTGSDAQRTLHETAAGAVMAADDGRDAVPSMTDPVRAEPTAPLSARTPVPPTGSELAPLVNPRASAAGSSSPYGRFTLFGDEDAAPGRAFGETVAIEGDVAVVGAPGFVKNGYRCGAVYVFERRNGAWTRTQRLDSPHPGIGGFVRRVAVVAGALVVTDGAVFRTYVRTDGGWVEASVTQLPSPMVWDAVGRGNVFAVSVRGAILLWRRVGDDWLETGRIDAPPDRKATRFGVWLSLDGDALAVHSDDQNGIGHGLATYVFRRVGDAFDRTPAATLVLPWAQRAGGTLAANGTALVQNNGRQEFAIDELTAAGSTRTTTRGSRNGSFSPLHGSRGMDGDGNLVVAIEVEPPAFTVLQRRDDGWYRTEVAAPDVPRDAGEALWHSHIAVSRRTVVAATIWDGAGSGRVWIFDIEDGDLAGASKVEPIPK